MPNFVIPAPLSSSSPRPFLRHPRAGGDPANKERARSAQLLRRWIGIAVTHLAISLIEKRMKDAFPDIPWVDASVLKSARREETGKQGRLL